MGHIYLCNFQTSQNLVHIQPCNSHAVYLLGSAQFNKSESLGTGEEAKKALHDARMSFETSIELQDKPAEGPVPELITGKMEKELCKTGWRMGNNNEKCPCIICFNIC